MRLRKARQLRAGRAVADVIILIRSVDLASLAISDAFSSSHSASFFASDVVRRSRRSMLAR